MYKPDHEPYNRKAKLYFRHYHFFWSGVTLAGCDCIRVLYMDTFISSIF